MTAGIRQPGARAPIHVRSPRPRAGPTPLRVGLLGFGTVGQGLARLVAERRAPSGRRTALPLEIVNALVRSAPPEREAPVPLEEDPARFLVGRYDVVVEALGGVEPAARLVGHVLDRGVPVVTANKALLAERGAELQERARRSGTVLRGEAAVAGGIPILGLLEHGLHAAPIDAVTGILNGTSNFVLTRMRQDGLRLGEAVEEARQRGFAEADPSLDLNGTDASQKLSLLSGHVGRTLPVPAVDVEGLGGVAPRDCAVAETLGARIRPVARADASGGFVGPTFVPAGHPLFDVDEELNGVVLESPPVGRLFLSGPGAGGAPTASALFDDLVAVARGGSSSPSIPIVSEPPAGAGARSPWWILVRFGCQATEGVRPLVESGGLHVRRRHVLAEGGLPVHAFLLATASRTAVQALQTRLGPLRSVTDVRAYRALDPLSRS